MTWGTVCFWWFSISRIALVNRSSRDGSVELRGARGDYYVEGGRWTQICRNVLTSLFGPPVNVEADGNETYDCRLIRPERWTRPVVVYHCFGGAHTSVVSGALHLGWLPRRGVLEREALEALEPFDSLETRIGQIHHLGRDHRGVEVKAMGFGGGTEILWPLYAQLMDMIGWSAKEIIDCHTLPAAGVMLRVGGFVSLHLGLTWPGRFLVIGGVRRAHAQLVDYVEGVERKLDAAGAPG